MGSVAEIQARAPPDPLENMDKTLAGALSALKASLWRSVGLGEET